MWQIEETTSTSYREQGEMATRAATQTMYHCKTFKEVIEVLEWCRKFHERHDSDLEVRFEIWEEKDGD